MKISVKVFILFSLIEICSGKVKPSADNYIASRNPCTEFWTRINALVDDVHCLLASSVLGSGDCLTRHSFSDGGLRVIGLLRW